jgi:hypothetical protein
VAGLVGALKDPPMLTWMWLTFFSTWEARGRALVYGAIFVVCLVTLGVIIQWAIAPP